MIEKVEAFWNNKPCNSGHSTEEPGTVVFAEQVSTKRYFVEPHIPSFARFADFQGKNVLELGCGIGTDAISFARYGAHVFACDLSDASLEIARKSAQNLGLKIAFFKQNLEEDIDFELPKQLDLIYSFGVIHHSPNPERIISNIAQLAGDATQIRMMVYHRFSTKAISLYLRYGLISLANFDSAVSRQSEAQKNCPITFTYSKKSIRRILEKHGLEVLSIEVAHIFPFRVSDYRKGKYRYRFVWRFFGNDFREWLQGRFGWHLLVVAQPRPSSE